MNKKVIFIPGWMDTVANRVDFPGLDIWLKNIDIEEKIDAEYVVGHSAGANWALINWEKNRNTKLILVMPGVPKRSLLSWFCRWIRFMKSEGTQISRKRIKCFWRFPQGAMLLMKLLKPDLMPTINKIPKDSLVFIRGKKDLYFFDEKIAGEIRSMGIKVIELDGVDHNWHEKIDEEIRKIIGTD